MVAKKSLIQKFDRQKAFKIALTFFVFLALLGTLFLIIGLETPFSSDLIGKTNWANVGHIFSIRKDVVSLLYGDDALVLLKMAIAGASLWFANIVVFLALIVFRWPELKKFINGKKQN